MAFWNSNEIFGINEGTSANDGTGDNIRDAFLKVDNNFSNVSVFLSQPTVDFLNANIGQQLSVNNLIVANVTSEGTFLSNINMSANIVPTVSGQYDLGSVSNPWRNLYVQTTVSTSQVQTSSDAGILTIHANANPGDIKDVGILGNVTSNYSGGSNHYAFFGHQHLTNNFIYKITPNNAASMGNSVVYDGVYGNTQFGSQYLSNTTPATNSSTGALIVAGGAGIGGDLYTGGNMFAYGGQVITTTSSGLGVLYNSGSIFTTNVSITPTTPSTGTNSGALIVAGGVGVVGNVTAGGLVGPLYGPVYGTVQTAAQPNITSVGTLSSLNVGSVSATGIGTNTLLVTGLATISGGISGLTTLIATGNVTVANLIANVGGIYGSINTAAQPNITSVGTLTSLVVVGNVTASNVSGTLSTSSQPNITSVGTLTGLHVNSSGIQSDGTVITGTVNAATIGNTGAVLTGTLSTASQPNITAVGTLTGLHVNSSGIQSDGTIVATTLNAATIGNIGANLVGTGTYLTSLNATNLTSGTVASARVAGAYTGITAVGTLTAGAIGTGFTAIPNSALANSSITVTAGTGLSGGGATALGGTVTLTNTGVTSAVAGTGVGVSGATGAVTISIGQAVGTGNSPTFAGISVPSITHTGTSGTGDIGASGAAFGTVYATATTALYADLAENYQCDNNYEPGTVVVFGGNEEITTTTKFADVRVAGAISTNPAHLMNGGLQGANVGTVALRGRIPVKVIGPVNKGDLLVTAGANPGYATSVGSSTNYPLAVFAKAIETNTAEGVKVIEAVIL